MQFSSTYNLRTLLFFALLCCGGLVAYGQRRDSIQTPPDANDVVRISTDLIQTDVMVFDQQGRPVGGLQREQFQLRVDGSPVPISFFEHIANTRSRAGSSSKNTTTNSAQDHGRQIVFFIDDLHMAADSMEQVRKALLQFVEGEMRTDDQIAIVSATGQVGFLEQFTDHKSVSRAAVARLKHRSNRVQDSESLAPMTEYVALRIAQGDRDTLEFYVNEMLRSTQFYFALPKYGGKGGGFLVGSESDQVARMVTQRAQSLLAQSSANSIATLSALEGFLRSSAGLRGRKLVFFVSDGFLWHGDAAFTNRLQRITDAAARAGSVIYALDARALAGHDPNSRTKFDSAGRLDKFNSGQQTASELALQTLAGNTGGRTLRDSKTLEGLVNNALKETFNYYLLAWRPEKESQKIQRYRQIEVSIAGRPDLSVRMPRGYLEAEGKTRLTQNDAGAVAPASNPSLSTRLSLGFLNVPNNGTVLATSTRIAIDALTFGENARAGAIDLAGVIMNDQGVIASSFQTRLNVAAVSSEQASAGNQSVIYNHRVPLQPGIYQVRVAARDVNNTRTGHAKQWIEIPDLAGKRLALSSLFLGGQAIEPGDARASGGTQPQMQFSVDRRFSRSSRLSFFLFVYNASRASEQATPNLTAQIEVTQGGQTVLTIPPQRVPIEAATDLQRIPYGGSFPLNSLPAGRYLLQITITDRSTSMSTSGEIGFEVE
jgi:VWFA-related protein